MNQRPAHQTRIDAGEMALSVGPRVLIISNDRDYFVHHRLPIVKRLIKRQCIVTVATGGGAEPPLEARGWTFLPLPFNRLSINPLSNLWYLLRCWRIIAQQQPSVLHLLTLKPALLGGLAAVALRFFGRGPDRILITIPGLGRLMAPGGTGAGLFSGIARWMVGKTMRFISSQDGVYVSFETAHDRDLWLSAGYVRSPYSTVINGAGVDGERYAPADPRQGDNPLRILFASRLLRSKGLGSFIEVSRRFVGNDRVVFAVAGMPSEGDPDAVSPTELRAEPSIQFLGRVSDMPSLLANTDVVCLPTRYGEGVPRILIEAAACGLPVIASDIPGCQEIAENGVTGFLIPAERPSEMSDALHSAVCRYLDDPGLARRHGAAGRKRFVSRGFDTASVEAGFEALLLGEPRFDDLG